jgi:hypothetical protein
VGCTVVWRSPTRLNDPIGASASDAPYQIAEYGGGSGPTRQWSSILGLVCKSGALADIIRAAIRDLWLSGIVSGDEQSGYRLTAAAEVSAQRKSSRAIRKPRP